MSQNNNLGPVVLLLGGALGALGLSQLIKNLRLNRRADFFQGKVVLLTGASRGIGRALALDFARRGAFLVLASRTGYELERVADECQALNPTIETLVVPTDVTQDAQLEALVAAALNRFGWIDILVNNAGIIQGGALHEITLKTLRAQIEVNLLSMMRLAQLVLPHMLQRDRGLIVNMASAAGRHVVPYFTPYGVSKFGLHGFTEGLRRELMGTGVSTLLVSPGFVESDIVGAVGATYRRMGFKIDPPERVAAKTLEGIVLGRREVNIGLFEYVGGWANRFFPCLADLFWFLLLPPDFPQIALRQRTE